MDGQRVPAHSILNANILICASFYTVNYHAVHTDILVSVEANILLHIILSTYSVPFEQEDGN